MTTICRIEHRKRKVAVATGILLLPGIISVGNSFSSNNNNIRILCNQPSLLFAIKNFHNQDQWNDNEEQIDDDVLLRRTKYYESSKRAVLGGSAIGTLMAINGAVDMSAGAEIMNNQAQTQEAQGQAQGQMSSVRSILANEQQQQPTGMVTLPYLEQQIKSAEEALRSDSNPTTTITEVATTATTRTTTTTNDLDRTGSINAPVQVAENNVQNNGRAQSKLAFADATTSASVSVSAATPTAVPTITNKINNNNGNGNGNINAPSLVQYTQSHIPGWIETGGNIYKTVEPKIVSGGQKLVSEVDKRVTPKIIEAEHQLLGDEKSTVVDETLSTVVRGGNMIVDMVGKVLSFGVEGGKMVAKTVPQVIDTGVHVYQTVDRKILPEVIDTSRKMKTIIDKAVPEVMDTGKHAYTTIMPEVAKGEKQLATTLREGCDIAVPIVQKIENKIVPELVQIERNVLGNKQAAMLEKSVSQATQQSQSVARAVEKVIPDVVKAGQQTGYSIISTGQSIAKNVPIMVKTGKHVYGTVDKSFTDALSTTQDIASDLDRAGGKAAYAIEGQMYAAADTIDKTLPILIENGRKVAVTVPKIAKTVETGGKAIIVDISGYVDDWNANTNFIGSASERRLASSKPIFRDITASVNDPNRMGSL